MRSARRFARALALVTLMSCAGPDDGTVAVSPLITPIEIPAGVVARLQSAGLIEERLSPLEGRLRWASPEITEFVAWTAAREETDAASLSWSLHQLGFVGDRAARMRAAPGRPERVAGHTGEIRVAQLEGSFGALALWWVCPETGRLFTMGFVGDRPSLDGVYEAAVPHLSCHGHGEVRWPSVALSWLPDGWVGEGQPGAVSRYRRKDAAAWMVIWRQPELFLSQRMDCRAAVDAALAELLRDTGATLVAAPRLNRSGREPCGASARVDLPGASEPARIEIDAWACPAVAGARPVAAPWLMSALVWRPDRLPSSASLDIRALAVCR
jgi:hypothetical protein